jgi:carbamoyltransferase
MGFKESEEGKVMALACHGKPGPLCGIFESLFKISHRRLKISNVYRKRAFLKMVKSFSREDAAYALQKAVEEAAVRYVSSFVPERGIPDLFLAGGFFANIKVTQRLIESGLFSRVFVFPNMGDGGTSFFGNGYRDMYLGPEFAEDEIRSLLESSKIPYADEPQVEEKIAVLLSQGKVVARFNGRMEFGPRALGNRSILYRADDPSANNWLNKRLKRDEFMPFSPATLSEFKEKCYLNINTGEFAARFMTASFNCTEFMRKSSPGAVHIDGTARPQIVSLEDNPGYYKVLRKYYEITGKPSIINTSFNMHNEPIVCSPKEAIATFREARLDYLAMGRFLIKGG